MSVINFDLLRKANITRLPKYRNKNGDINHKKPDGSDWAPEQWLQALSGELGEYANFRKKYERGDFTLEEFRIEAGKELADVQIYFDILAMRCLDLYDVAHPKGMSLNNLPMEINPKFVQMAGHNAARCHQALTAKIGAYADLRESLELGDINATKFLSSLPACLGAIQAHLQLLAKSCLNTHDYVDDHGIDLWQSSIDKFNEVSDRVNVDVYIVNDDVSSMSL